jgi:phosphoglycolate phosphatase-like HAD superfamily hydrolase
MRRLVLFDIDGTLIWTDGAGRSALRQALVAEMGTAGPIDGFRFDGKTDPQIVRELLTAARHPSAESATHIDAVCLRYVTLLRDELDRGDRVIRVFPGVADLLGRIEAQADYLLGLLTGNLAEGAALKLAAAGLDPGRFRVGAYGSDAADRPALPAIAATRAAAFMGRTPRGDDVVIIGDTPADVTCGRAIGARSIGVATGAYSRRELESAGAFAAFDDFSDVAAVLAAIGE